MHTNWTELVFILDRSGSMCGLEHDTIGGYNAMLEKQKKEPGEAAVTTVLFDDRYELLHNRLPLRDVAPISERDYFVRGNTALLDAIGRTIHQVAGAQRHAAPYQREGRVLFVITTDGHENASREFTHAQVRHMVEEQKRRYGWEFLFLGANIDAIASAARFGISEDRAANYHADGAGTRLNYEVVSQAVSCIRASRPLSAAWKARIDEDYKIRRR